MSQDFRDLLATGLIKEDREQINKNFNDVRSCHSGDAFPSNNLVEGMLFFNNSTKRLYQLQPDLNTWILLLDLSSGVAVVPKASSATEADKATADANGKEIASYVAKLETDAEDAFVINFYDGNNNKLGFVAIPETKIEIMSGASASANGYSGLVPQPQAGDNEKFLCGDGTFKTAAIGLKVW